MSCTFGGLLPHLWSLTSSHAQDPKRAMSNYSNININIQMDAHLNRSGFRQNTILAGTKMYLAVLPRQGRWCGQIKVHYHACAATPFCNGFGAVTSKNSWRSQSNLTPLYGMWRCSCSPGKRGFGFRYKAEVTHMRLSTETILFSGAEISPAVAWATDNLWMWEAQKWKTFGPAPDGEQL